MIAMCSIGDTQGTDRPPFLMRCESRFTGKERDAESGNDYFGARYYGSSMGRWLSPDWSAKIMPVPYAKLDNPQSLNLYAYVGNNPLIHVDADGHIIDDSALEKNKEYQKWKTNFLSHDGAQAQWDALNNNKDLTVTMKWDTKGSASVTARRRQSLPRRCAGGGRGKP